MTLDPVAVVHGYDEAWADIDPSSPRASLRAVWAQDGRYVDPDVPEGVRGAEALALLIESSLEQYPGLTIIATSELAMLGDRAWYSWRASLPAGGSFTGLDFFEFAADGRIARVTNYYDSQHEFANKVLEAGRETRVRESARRRLEASRA